MTGVDAVTAMVCTVTLALDRPAGTVRLAGTGNTALLLESATAAPPGGAAPLSITLTVAAAPPAMVVGFTVNDVTVGSTTGATVTFTVALVEL